MVLRSSQEQLKTPPHLKLAPPVTPSHLYSPEASPNLHLTPPTCTHLLQGGRYPLGHQVDCRVPTAQGKQGKWPKKIPCQGKHKEFGNSATTLGILFAQVVNSLLLKIQDVVIISCKILDFSAVRFGYEVSQFS